MFLLKKIIGQVKIIYHWLLTLAAAIYYRFPSKKIKVVAITGTKGKTTCTELVSALLEAGGHKTAIVSTLRFKIGDQSERNLLKMTTPGRGAIQKILRQAVDAGCDYAIIELSSEGARQYRHAFIELNALIFTNLSPEHIESHGSYEKYVAAKLSIARALAKSPKAERILVANSDDRETEKFLALNIPHKIRYSLKDAKPYELDETGASFTFDGEKITTQLAGEFNIYNMLAAAVYAKSQGVTLPQIKTGLANFTGVLGRMQKVYSNRHKDKQDFDVIVDYAHTADSLKAAYSVYTGKKKMICVLGSCGGGRDKWKRPAMGKIANDYCDEIILTNEDPYEEDPNQIICDVGTGITKKYETIIDRRAAIRSAIARAEAGTVIMITGKGTDPFLMEANGKKTPWSDAKVAEEELDAFLSSQ